MKKAGLEIFCAIAWKITSYSREIFDHISSLLYHGLFPAIAGNCPSFVFPAIAALLPRFNWPKPGTCPSFLIWRRKASMLKTAFWNYVSIFSIVVKEPACDHLGLGLNPTR